MKPRFDEAPVLVKALELERRLNDLAIHKAKCDCPEGKCDCKDCPSCGSKMNKMGCMKMGCGGKMAKAEDCPKCGSKMNKMGCMKMGCGGKMAKAEDCPKCGSKMNKMGCMKMGCNEKMAKAQPGYKAEKISDVNPHMVTETGGQTRTAYYTTNGKTIESEDAKKKPKKKDATSLESLGNRLNPHSGTGAEREDTAGEKGL